MSGAGLVHDAAAPLMVIEGFADALARAGDVDEAVRRDYATRILRAAAELRELLREGEPGGAEATGTGVA